MEKHEGLSWSERAGKTFCILCLILGIYLVIKYALVVLLPFLIAWSLALITSPLAKKMSKSFGISRRFSSAFLTVVLLGGLALTLYFAALSLINETEKLLSRLSSDSDRLGNAVADFFERLSSMGSGELPFLDELMKIEAFRRFWENMDEIVANTVSDIVSSITKQIPSFMLGVIKEAPNVLIFVLITLISCFYFAADIDRINKKAVSLLPQRFREKLPLIKQALTQKAGKYARAYLILLFMTFGELLVGLLILGADYPFLLAVLIAILDILPIFGVGTALIPWAIAEILFMKNYYMGIGLFILYVIITVVRQATEPKIVAGSLGLHPLLTLIAMYVGLKLFGVLGMILAPLALILTKSWPRVDNSLFL